LISLIIFVVLIYFVRKDSKISFKLWILNTLSYIKKIFLKYATPITRSINPYPFQSLLLQFTVCYLIFFSIFITHPFPILKRWPKTTNSILISILVSLLLALFIQFNVPIARTSGFKPNIRHLRTHIGLFASLLAAIFAIMILGIGISYLASQHTDISLFAAKLGIAALTLFIFYITFSFVQNIFSLNLPPISETLIMLLIFIPVVLYDLWVKAYREASTPVLILLAIEISIIIAYFVIPMVINFIYLKNPGDPDHNKMIYSRIRGIQDSVSKQKEILKDQKGGINIDWSKPPTLDDNGLQSLLYDAGYTTADMSYNIQYIRQNEEGVNKDFKVLQELTDNLLSLEKAGMEDTAETSTRLLGDPIYTDKETTIGTQENLTTQSDYNYQYALSMWFFIHDQGPNHSAAYNKFTRLFNYGGRPSIVYNPKKNKLRITMLKGKKEKIIYETTTFALQKWNNIVINYDKGTLDVFINGVLVASQPGIVPYLLKDNIAVGANKGISGGVCNVVYYTGILSKDRIENVYYLLKKSNPPLFT